MDSGQCDLGYVCKRWRDNIQAFGVCVHGKSLGIITILRCIYIQWIILWLKLFDVLNYFSIESTCFYDVLEHPPKDPGESLSPYYPHVIFRHVAFIRCKEECDNNPRCNNIKMCDDGCTLFDKPLFDNAPASDKPNPKNCYTIFKTCPGSNQNISI